MMESEKEKGLENVCDLSYLNEMLGGKKQMIIEMMDIFLEQIPNELHSINEAVIKEDYLAIKQLSHKMKSTVSVMGISSLKPVLEQMEVLGAAVNPDINRYEKIKTLSAQLNVTCSKALQEIEIEKMKISNFNTPDE